MRTFGPTLLGLALAAPLAVGSGVRADDLDDALGGFEDEIDVPDAQRSERTSPAAVDRWWDLTGSVDLTSTVNYLAHESSTGTDYTGLSMLRTRLELQLDLELPWDWEIRAAGVGFYDFSYLIHGLDNFTPEVLDDYEWWADTKEVWIQGTLIGDLDLKLGRQIVNWGRSDSLRVLDVLNPLDNREPGLADIEFLRLPVMMIKLDYYWGDWTFSGMAIPEIRTSINPPLGSDFFPPPAFQLTPDQIRLIELSQPDASLENTQWAASIQGIFSGWDISFHFARLWEDRFYLNGDLSDLSQPAAFPDLRQSWIHVYGAGGNYTVGSWLFKGEVAGTDGLRYTNSAFVPPPPLAPPGLIQVPTGFIETWRLDGMVGAEYYGIDDITVALEFAYRRIFDYEEGLALFGAIEGQTEIALRVTGSFFNDRLSTTFLGLVIGDPAPDTTVVRLSANYELRDALGLEGGIVLYNTGGNVTGFSGLGSNDRLFAQLKYSF